MAASFFQLHYTLLLWISLYLCSAAPDEAVSSGKATRPNLILLVVDDWGFNDVSWHDHSDISMPFLDDHVRNEAMAVDTFYTYPLCSISRAALLTGRYPSRYGLHYSVIENGYTFGLSVFETTLAEELKAAGYQTAMVGKWHQGFHRHDMTPLQRGFDHFYGSLSPMINFWTYSYGVTGTDYGGRDLWEMNTPVHFEGQKGTYLTYWERDYFMSTLDTLVTDATPFFMYVALHASHYPHAAPDDAVSIAKDNTMCDDDAYDPHNELMCSSHVIVQGQTVCADTVIEAMITKLKNTNNAEGTRTIWEDTVLYFLSDNGGAVWEMDNSPLRGGKMEILEGGVRTPAFISGGYLDEMERGGVFGDGTTPFHVTDVMPTFLKLAGVETRVGEKVLDGQDQISVIQGMASTEKREFLYNVYPADECDYDWCGAYRYGDFKLIRHALSTNVYWYDFYATSRRYNNDASLNEDYSNFLGCSNIPDGTATDAEYDSDGNEISGCEETACLFNLADDPCEYTDLSGDPQYEAVIQYMSHMMQAYYDNQQTALHLEYSDADPDCDPQLKNGFWQPWVRDYSHDDEVEDFEDLMSNYASQNKILEDIHSDPSFIAAQSYKMQWEAEQIKDKHSGHRKMKKSELSNTMVWIMLGIITLLLMVVFVSTKIYKTTQIGKRWGQKRIDVRAVSDEDEYSPLVH